MKKIFCIVIILLVLAIFGGIYFGNSNYSKEKALSLLEKGISQNYSMEVSNKNQSLLFKHKDNVFIITSLKENEDKFEIYENFDTDEIIIMDEEYAVTSKISTYTVDENDKEYLQPYMNTTLDSIKSENYQYTFIEKTKYDDQSCIVINLLNPDENNFSNLNYTINAKTGVIHKIETLNQFGKVVDTIEFKVTLDSVTDEDIKRPDLSKLNTFNID